MPFLIRRFFALCVFAVGLVILFHNSIFRESAYPASDEPSVSVKGPLNWKAVPLRYPVTSMIALPTGSPVLIPRIQHEFGPEPADSRNVRVERREAVKAAFLRSWNGYKKHAWLKDEVAPLSGGFKNGFGGWGATLVDSLDTLLIMGLDDEFKLALSGLAKIDFSTSNVAVLNVFETTIRYLGGLLSAYDLSGEKHQILIDKAVELGDMLYIAFDTANRMPITRWDWINGVHGGEQKAPLQVLSAELGSLSLEFTRLSQITGDNKYFDAVQRVTNKFERYQNSTALPGMWPIIINARHENFNPDGKFTLGGMADSLYEYFPKQYLLLGGLIDQYRTLYEKAIDAAKRHLFFRPMNPENRDILLSGNGQRNIVDDIKLDPEGQHLTCFVGGMVAIGAKIFKREHDLDVARKLVDGCIWAYDSMPTGIMPEIFRTVACPDPHDCEWNEEEWHTAVSLEWHGDSQRPIQAIIKEYGLVPGFSKISDRRFLLRPEAIESVFVLYRITGDQELQEAAWRMFESINKSTQTPIGHAAIVDVTTPPGKEILKADSCESFWMAETLKYFYLVFSEPDVVSLDEWVFNTEAHPLRRPQRK